MKTSLPDDLRKNLVGEGGRSALYRALIAQLAVANGMPQLASYFYEQVTRASAESPIQVLEKRVIADSREFTDKAFQQLPWLVTALRSSGDGIHDAEPLSIKHMREMIGFARRYSFERR